MDLQHIRRTNLRKLALAKGGIPELASATGIDLAYLYRMIGPNPSKPVTDKMATKIENRLALPDGELSSLFRAVDQKGQYDTALLTAQPHTMQLITTVLDNAYKIDSEVATVLASLLNRIK